MQVEEGNPIPKLLALLSNRLDYTNHSGPPEHGENLYNKAWGIIDKDMRRNGLPSVERAFNLCIVGGVPEKLTEKKTTISDHLMSRGVKNKKSPFGKRYF